MVRSAIVALVSFCTRRPVLIVLIALILAGGSTVYAVRHFALKTNVTDLISPNVPWSQRGAQFLKDFPQQQIIVVVDAPTAELVDQAAAKLAQALRQHPKRFLSVSEPGSGPFFERNGLLFLPEAQVAEVTGELRSANPFIGALAADPSLRGALGALSLALSGVQFGQLKLDDLVVPLNMAADTADAVLAARPASFSWRALTDRKPPAPQDLRRFIQVQPILDFSALRPGHAATEAISRIASDLGLATAFQARVRQTGAIPMDDDQFGTISQNAGITMAVSVSLVVIILLLALRSIRTVAAVMVTLTFGLAISAAAGLALVGAFNLISIAFFVLFVGLGVDFAIQFSVRYRSERHEHPELHEALRSTALKAGIPLSLAAVAIVAGFSSFMPTDYIGLSELGEIAGAGMIVAFLCSITLLPALLTLFNPPGELHPMGFSWLAPVDRFTARHRIPIVVITLLIVLAGTPLLLHLPFDFNPTHLQDPKTESVKTYLELKSEPQTGANAIEIEAPDLKAADATAGLLAKLPEVSQTRTLSRLIPQNQDEKLKLIRAAAQSINPSLDPEKVETPPTDQQNVDSLTATAGSLTKAAGTDQGTGAVAARRLASLLTKLAGADPEVRTRAEAAVAEPLRFALGQLRLELDPQQRHHRYHSAGDREAMGDGRRTRADTGSPQRRPREHRHAPQFRHRGTRHRPRRHRTRRAALRGGADRHPCVHRGGRVRALGHHRAAAHRAAPGRRRAAHPRSVAGRRRRDLGAVRHSRHPAQLRQYHRAAAAARRRCRLQDLLHHGVAGRENAPAAVEPHPRGDLQRDDDRVGLRQSLALRKSGHLEHGRNDGSCARLHHGGGGVLPAGADGAAAQGSG